MHLMALNPGMGSTAVSRLSEEETSLPVSCPGLEPTLALQWRGPEKKPQVLCSHTEVWPLPSTTILWSTDQGDSGGKK